MSGEAPAWVAKSQNQSRLAFGQALTALAADPEIVAVTADTWDLLGLRELVQAHRERVIDVGIAEQDQLGVAAGLATTGLRPFVCGYAPFITARAMEQLRNDIAYAHQRVVVGAAAAGISLGVSGGTHHAIEDLALMRAMPNMTVLVPADAHEAYHATFAAAEVEGPVYLRLGGRTTEPPVTPIDAPFRIGRATTLRPGTDVAVIACGCLVAPALEAAREAQRQGVSVRVVNMATVKPLDREAVLDAAATTRGVVAAEEHHVTGGLGGAIAELLAQERPTRMRFVGMPDEFACVGPTDRVRARYGMGAQAVLEACLALAG